jgi:hypothetical protein
MLGVLGGSVQFAEGGPATLATVTIVGPSGPQTQLVDGSGYFYFGNLPLGLYSVTISDPGYRGVVHGDLLVGSVNSSVWQTTTLDVLAPVGNVSGRVTCGGAGVGGATVSAGEVLTITAADGSYMLAGVDAGSAHATFSKAGFVSQELPVFVTQGATNLLNASLNYEQTGCTIARSPDKSSLSYKRRKGSVKFTLQATLSGPYWKFVAAPAYLQTSSNGKSRWKTAYQLKTNAAGVATKAFTARSKSTKYYRWYAPSTAMHAATYSGKQKVVVK